MGEMNAMGGGNEDLTVMKTLEQMDWWKEIKQEQSCTLEAILYEMMWENGHGGLKNKKIQEDGEREGDGVMKAH